MNRQQRYSDDSGFNQSGQPGWRNGSAPQARSGEVLASQTSAQAPSHASRGPQGRSLTTAAHDWLARLPPRYQPLATARRHPHIVNRLSALWDLPSQLRGYFHELMLSNRSHRAGFSFDVLIELTDLQAMLEQSQRRRRH